MSIKVNLVDDHKVVTEGLNFILEKEEGIDVLDIAHTGAIALAQLKERTPDVVLLDYRLNEGENSDSVSGYEVAKIILNQYPSVKIMMLTMHNRPEIVTACVSLGVHGYMLKSEEDADFGSAIRELLQSGCYFSPSIAKNLAMSMRYPDEIPIDLTEREREVLECLFKGSSTKEIGEELFISHHTVDSHRKHLMQKFEAKNSVHLIYLALQKGILTV